MLRRKTDAKTASLKNVAKAVAFEDAKHFHWSITEPQTSDDFPGRIYYSAAVQVGGRVVVTGSHLRDWPVTRVIFYDIQQHSWSIVHSNGPSKPRRGMSPPVLGLVADQVFVLDAQVPVVHSFDLVLRDWIPLDVKGITADVDSCARCFMENINSFIYWDLSKGPTVSVLDLNLLTWRQQATKGEVPIYRNTSPLSCCHGSTVYLACEDHDLSTVLYLLSKRESTFYWSKPEINGLRPMFSEGGTLTYSSGRLFRFGGFASHSRESLQIYLLEAAEWHVVDENAPFSEYTVQGDISDAGAHSAVAIRGNLIVFGGLYVEFKKCRLLSSVGAIDSTKQDLSIFSTQTKKHWFGIVLNMLVYIYLAKAFRLDAPM